MELNSVEEIIDDIRLGRMVILMDDEDRENEGDIVIAAQKVRPEDINFMATHARGLICLTLSEERCKQLDLPLMVRDNRAALATNFTVSIEAAEGVTTGISAADRARTVHAAVTANAQPKDLVQPGHIFPLMAQQGGVLTRAGHTEAGCDLSRLAGFDASSVIVEVMNDDGTMARRPELETFAKTHNIKIGTIADLIHYRMMNEKTIICINERKVNTQYGEFSLRTYENSAHKELHFALVKGEVSGSDPVLVRVHVAETARDLLTIQRDHQGHPPSWNFQRAMKRVADEGCGVLVLICHLESTAEIEDSIERMMSGKQLRPKAAAAYKQIGAGAQILKDLGVQKMRLMSAPFKFSGISGFDLEVTEYIDNEA